MIEKAHIRKLAEEVLEGTDLYVVEVEILPSERIFVYLDSPGGARIEDCIRVSRHIEGSLDREKQDFELNVSSAGMDRPLIDARQFQKALEKPVSIKLKDGRKLEGIYGGEKEGAYLLLPEIKKGSKKKASALSEEMIIEKENVLEFKRAVRFK
jgi:ribosome maturation factor RimP